jgi:hypothetical protein
MNELRDANLPIPQPPRPLPALVRLLLRLAAWLDENY